MPKRTLTALLLVLAVIIILAVTPAVAAPSSRGPGSGGRTPSASMSVEPNTAVAWGGSYTISGSGFYPNRLVSISMSSPACCVAFNVWADSSGAVSFSRTAGHPGIYTVNAFQPNGRKYILMASVSFAVLPP
jgi:hypothetical protein